MNPHETWAREIRALLPQGTPPSAGDVRRAKRFQKKLEHVGLLDIFPIEIDEIFVEWLARELAVARQTPTKPRRRTRSK